jgi:ABC-type transporter Mla MlaB component
MLTILRRNIGKRLMIVNTSAAGWPQASDNEGAVFWTAWCLFDVRGNPMLHFSYYRSDDGEQWKLWGQLSGAWVDELRSVWRRIRQHVHRGRAVVDLKEVTSIDPAGEQLLAEMRLEGADLVQSHILSGTGGANGETPMEHASGGRS